MLAPLGPNAPPTNNNTGTPGSIIKVPPGTFNPAGNATNPSSNTGTESTDTGLAGQQTQQTTGHHQKGSKLGGSTSNCIVLAIENASLRTNFPNSS